MAKHDTKGALNSLCEGLQGSEDDPQATSIILQAYIRSHRGKPAD